jgi:hypothetical protein
MDFSDTPYTASAPADFYASEGTMEDTETVATVASEADTMESAEMALEELQQHPEATQLEILTYESEHLLEHGIQPSQEWYEARFLKIYEYSELNWRDLAHRYQLDNTYLAEKAVAISNGLHHLIEEWSASPIFDLSVYYAVLHDMNELWKYYESEYMDENHDTDVSELIANMKHL